MDSLTGKIEIDDHVIVASESTLFDDVRGVPGIVTKVQGLVSDPNFTVRFEGGHVIRGLHEEDLKLTSKSEWGGQN